MKRTPLKRGNSRLTAKTPLSRGNSTLKRTPLKASSSSTASKGNGLSRTRKKSPGEDECRKIVKQRSQGMCEICERNYASDMAHRVAVSQRGKWEPANILHACRFCPSYNHAHTKEAYEKGQHLKYGSDPLSEKVLLGNTWYLLGNDGSKTEYND